jgi:3-hydroxy-3-methylglutaryl CoA synthase
MAVLTSMGWFAPGLMMSAQGERAMCGWDEDAMTLAVSAARDCLTGMDKGAVDAAYLASTSLPFKDRQNSGILAAAANLKEAGLVTADFTSSSKSGTTAILTAIDALKGGEKQNILVTAADARPTKAAWFFQLWFGDGAASVLLGKDKVIAEFKGSYSVSCDFVPSYRGANAQFDYGWEERWIRDEGYTKILPQAIKGLLDKTGTTMNDVSKVIFPCYLSKRIHGEIAKLIGAGRDKVVDNLYEVVGDTGAAQPLVMLVSALENAKPGDKIVVASFGQGSDAILFQVTDAIKDLPPRRGLQGSLANRKEEDNYAKLLKWRDLINVDMGIRAEAKKQTALSALWRNRKAVLGMVGGKCTKCGTPQFPLMRVCVNPNCHAVDTQVEEEFAHKPAIVKSFTGDMLAVSVEPPAIYGLVEFPSGGRTMADFADCELSEVKVGMPVQMSFRIKYYDEDRDFHGYFWKATPKR